MRQERRYQYNKRNGTTNKPIKPTFKTENAKSSTIKGIRKKSKITDIHTGTFANIGLERNINMKIIESNILSQSGFKNSFQFI